MNVGIIGSGGREHAICVSIKQSNKAKNIFCLPGNAGTQNIANNIKVNIDDFEEIRGIVKNKKNFLLTRKCWN